MVGAVQRSAVRSLPFVLQKVELQHRTFTVLSAELTLAGVQHLRKKGKEWQHSGSRCVNSVLAAVAVPAAQQGNSQVGGGRSQRAVQSSCLLERTQETLSVSRLCLRPFPCSPLRHHRLHEEAAGPSSCSTCGQADPTPQIHPPTALPESSCWLIARPGLRCHHRLYSQHLFLCNLLHTPVHPLSGACLGLTSILVGCAKALYFFCILKKF